MTQKLLESEKSGADLLQAIDKIDREETLEYPLELLPADAQFKGYEEVIVQDITLSTNNVLFRKSMIICPSSALSNLPVSKKQQRSLFIISKPTGQWCILSSVMMLPSSSY